MGVVIGETTVIGDDCLIYKGVVLGGTTLSQTKRHPTLGSGVVVGSNACILGAVEIGDDARVGSGSVVIKDVPNKATVIGIPGRIVSRRQKVEQLPLPRLDHAALPDPMMRLVHKMFTSMEALSERIQTLEHHTDLSPEQLAEVLEPDTLQTELEEAFLALYEESEITNEPR
jgi:serine O-acetyltransferase